MSRAGKLSFKGSILARSNASTFETDARNQARVYLAVFLITCKMMVNQKGNVPGFCGRPGLIAEEIAFAANCELSECIEELQEQCLGCPAQVHASRGTCRALAPS